MFNTKTNKMKEKEITNDLSTLPSFTDKDISPYKGIKYLNVTKRNILIREIIFFVSGLYSAKSLSNMDLLNADTTPTIIASIIFIICWLVITKNVFYIIISSFKWLRSLK